MQGSVLSSSKESIPPPSHCVLYATSLTAHYRIADLYHHRHTVYFMPRHWRLISGSLTCTTTVTLYTLCHVTDGSLQDRWPVPPPSHCILYATSLTAHYRIADLYHHRHTVYCMPRHCRLITGSLTCTTTVTLCTLCHVTDGSLQDRWPVPPPSDCVLYATSLTAHYRIADLYDARFACTLCAERSVCSTILCTKYGQWAQYITGKQNTVYTMLYIWYIYFHQIHKIFHFELNQCNNISLVNIFPEQ